MCPNILVELLGIRFSAKPNFLHFRSEDSRSGNENVPEKGELVFVPFMN